MKLGWPHGQSGHFKEEKDHLRCNIRNFCGFCDKKIIYMTSEYFAERSFTISALGLKKHDQTNGKHCENKKYHTKYLSERNNLAELDVTN
jgi:hypothetical protein